MPSSTDAADGRFAWAVERHAELDSTSDLIRQRARDGAAEGLVVVAGRQLAGRGRHGRGWQSPVGNLYLTLLLRPGVPAAAAAGLSLVTGVALARACLDLGVPRSRLYLKWPNDLLVDEGKVAGILLETDADERGGVAWLSIGIGVNVRHAPELPDRPTTSLASVLPELAPAEVERCLLARLAEGYATWRAHGMAPIVAAWQELGADPGAPMTVKLGDRILAGRYAGIDQDGALRLDCGQIMRVTAGEVFLGTHR